MYRDGNPEFDCMAILEEMYKADPVGASPGEKASKWNLLWHDLQSKSESVDPLRRRQFLSVGLESLLPREMRPVVWSDKTRAVSGSEKRTPVGVMLLTVIEEEFNATLAAFGINQLKRKKP